MSLPICVAYMENDLMEIDKITNVHSRIQHLPSNIDNKDIKDTIKHSIQTDHATMPSLKKHQYSDPDTSLSLQMHHKVLAIQEEAKELQTILSFRQAQIQYLSKINQDENWRNKFIHFSQPLGSMQQTEHNMIYNTTMNEYSIFIQKEARSIRKKIDRNQITMQNIFASEILDQSTLKEKLVFLKDKNISSSLLDDYLDQRKIQRLLEM